MPRKFLTTLFKGENTPVTIRASSFFYPEHLFFTFAQKSQGGQGPPGMPRGGKRTTAPPPVYATDPKLMTAENIGFKKLSFSRVFDK